ncbi:MAG TPA: hypothetical protein VMN43_04035 [Aestuariivirgaceae bacterium]|nr:hypothetical protein [Aestuariivirgaceae bacterium]
MTPAERQRRRRKRLKREHRAVELEATQARNLERLRKHQAENPPIWHHALPVSPLDSPADELARQIADMLESEQNVTIDELRDALDRRFGPQQTPKGSP